MIDLLNHASCRKGIAVLVCQLAVGICAEEAVGEFSCGYVCKKCFDAVIKYQAKKKAFVALEKDLLGRLSAKTMQSSEGRGVKRPRVSVMTKSQVYVHMHRLHIDARLIDE